MSEPTVREKEDAILECVKNRLGEDYQKVMSGLAEKIRFLAKHFSQTNEAAAVQAIEDTRMAIIAALIEMERAAPFLH